MTEQDYIALAREGNREAYAELVRLHQGMVRGFLARRIFNPDDVIELAQEVFVSGWQHLGVFEESRDFGAWLRGIARNAALEHLRKNSRRLQREQDFLAHQVQEWAMQRQKADVRAETVDQLRYLQWCLDKLQRTNQFLHEILVMRYFRNASAREIGAALGKKENAVRVMLLRLREQLRLCLEESLKKGELPNVNQ